MNFVSMKAQALRRMLAGIGVVVVLGLSGATGAAVSERFFQTAEAAPALFDEDTVVALYERSIAAVVEVDVRAQSSTNGPRRFRPQSGQGSGFLIDAEKGHILTNYHVIQGAGQVRVTFSDGRTASAQVAGTSPADDLALLKVDPSEVQGIQPLPLGDSAAAKPGQMAIALGSPYGLEESITVGVVSGVNRTRSGLLGRSITGMIQTDAQLNPGNSGGPLLNSRGEVIGINNQIEASLTGNGSTGIGFAVPINTAKAILTQLEQGQAVARAYLGVQATTVTPELADLLGLEAHQGAYILSVSPRSPAAAAGLVGARIGLGGEQPSTVGDVITAVDGQAIRSVDGLISAIASHKPGDSIRLTIERAGETQEVNVTLGEWPDPAGVVEG